MTNLFGDPEIERTGARTDAERKRDYRRAAAIPRGYAAPPGTGPEGETCQSCKHIARVQHSKVYIKCRLNQAKWTGGPKTDIRARSPACAKWEKQ